ncbi:hypothetical protein [Acinetobacter sp. ANC 4648]|uniref:hypothetical protein n=1 Tax=Acinetobacter sp. ANC 4648 TaxID=1977875 RepID=UPI000A343492|nr:hypothetical protein [Acinetobacter sp. ANC 4648]OTG84780.1 hypothetical protein B9T27_00730 [Acinetobacter sp. ANC 4648]
MLNKVVLLDLENNMPTAKVLQDIVKHYSTLYFFNCDGKFEYALEDLTELASWVSSGQVVVLETPKAKEKEFEYAVVVGQLIALVEPDAHVEVISAMPSSEMLIQMMSASDLSCSLVLIQPASTGTNSKYKTPSVATIKEKPYLQMVKRYCDALGKMTGQPNTIEKLRNSIGNILQVVPENAQHLVGMLINLKIIKRDEEQIFVRKKVLRQWTQLNLDEQVTESKLESIDVLLENLKSNTHVVVQEDEQQNSVQNIQKALFKNFEKIDPMQIQVIHKLDALKSKKPKDIYELRDLLEQMFPKSDVRSLLKELVEKGYISWNGRAVIYSHEMFLN